MRHQANQYVHCRSPRGEDTEKGVESLFKNKNKNKKLKFSKFEEGNGHPYL